ncbi:hypothetical protein BD779DRAFT_1397118, partial [Infundibulicybe gibba]
FCSAESRPTSTEFIDRMPEVEERPWRDISSREVLDAISKTLARSAPGPEHVKW